MSLLTRCPACTTLYRVVPDQLRISEGWVKCGQCGDIFDASQHLIEASIDPDPQSFDDAEVSSVDAPVFQAHAYDFAGPEVREVMEPSRAVVEEIEVQPTDLNAFPEDEPAADYVLEQHPEPTQVRWDDDVLVASANDSGNGDPEAAPVMFMQADKRPVFWQRPLVRGALVFVSFALGLALLAQWVYFERDRLAAQWPGWRPALQTLCGVANCDVKPLQRIDALSVDSVGFHQLGKDTYRLTFTVKNASNLSLAIPAAELALTDAQDSPVYRRVFSVKELGAEGKEIAAGADWSAVVMLQLNPASLTQRVLGYRLLVFYP